MRHAATSRGAQACGAKVAKHAVGESAPFNLNGQRNRCGVFKEPGAEGGCVLWASARSPQGTPTDSVGFLEGPTARAPERSEGSTHRNEVRSVNELWCLALAFSQIWATKGAQTCENAKARYDLGG